MGDVALGADGDQAVDVVFRGFNRPKGLKTTEPAFHGLRKASPVASASRPEGSRTYPVARLPDS